MDPPAEDRNGIERSIDREISSVFQFSPEVLKALGETLRSKVQLVEKESELKVLRKAKEDNNSCQPCVSSGSLKSPVSFNAICCYIVSWKVHGMI